MISEETYYDLYKADLLRNSICNSVRNIEEDVNKLPKKILKKISKVCYFGEDSLKYENSRYKNNGYRTLDALICRKKLFSCRYKMELKFADIWDFKSEPNDEKYNSKYYKHYIDIDKVNLKSLINLERALEDLHSIVKNMLNAGEKLNEVYGIK